LPLSWPDLIRHGTNAVWLTFAEQQLANAVADLMRSRLGGDVTRGAGHWFPIRMLRLVSALHPVHGEVKMLGFPAKFGEAPSAFVAPPVGVDPDADVAGAGFRPTRSEVCAKQKWCERSG
jgi:hypothetical protein